MNNKHTDQEKVSSSLVDPIDTGDSVKGTPLTIVSERPVPENIPFEKVSIGFYRSRVDVETTRLSNLEYGVILTFVGSKPKDNHLVARLHIELKSEVDADNIKLHYLSKVDDGDYDKQLKKILSSLMSQHKAQKRSKAK